MSETQTDKILRFYPRIYFACHTRHVSDSKTKRTLTAHQASILDHLFLDEGIGLYDLAKHMGVTPSTMSLAITRLEAWGYVEKGKDSEDARRTLLCLTDEGERIKRSKSVLDSGRVKKLLSRLTEKEKEIAIRGLALLASAADLEMRSQSLSKAWGSRSAKGKKKNRVTGDKGE